MALVTKEDTVGRSSAQDTTLQSASSTGKSGGSSAHANAVSLEVPVKVHGSRPASDNSQSERFEEQTSTIIVFPEGGVLRMTTVVAAGQMLVLTNLKSRQDAICRVVKVRVFSKTQSYVEVEFTRSQASYWGVYFPSTAPRDESPSTPNASVSQSVQQAPEPAASVNLPAAPAEPCAPELVEDIADSHEVNPLKLPVPPAPSPKPSSPFASLGMRENVQPAAAATTSAKSPGEDSGLPGSRVFQPAARESSPYASPVRDRSSRTSTPQYTGASASAPSTSSATTGTSSDPMPSGSGDDVDLALDLEEVSPAAKPVAPTASFGTISFGTRLDSKLGYAQADSLEPRHNWLLVAASVVVLLGTAAGGAWYFRSNFAKSAIPGFAAVSSRAKPPVSQSSAPTAIQTPAATQPSSSGATGSIPANGTANPSAGSDTESFASETPQAKPAPPAGIAKPREQSQFTVESSPTPVSIPPSQPAARPGAASSMLSASAMKAHPLTSQRDISSPDAPVLNVTSGVSRETAGLPSLGPSGAPAIAPPPGANQAPMQVGGTVKQPKLISSVMPVYPFAAREANVQGDVVIDTQIGPNGSVTHMKVISGPTMLRQAAQDALRRWQYQPSQLDGKPVAVQMLVTIRFRL